MCHGNGDDHCCWIDGEECPFLERNTVEGRTFACGLYRELGDWEKVHADPRWKMSGIARWFRENFPDFGCGDWPQNLEPLSFGTGRCCYG